LSIRSKYLKKPIHYPPTDPPLEDIRTEVAESGQKRRKWKKNLENILENNETLAGIQDFKNQENIVVLLVGSYSTI